MNMPDKKFVCQVDGRRFKTAAALQQHRRTSHLGGENATARGSGRGNAPVSFPSMVKSVSNDIAKLTGTDRLASGTISAKNTSGQALVDFTITPILFRRLKAVSTAFQRIRYLRLRFRMEPQVSTQTSGGYVLGFIRDPDDSTTQTLDTLTAQRGSVTTKWWQSSSVDVPVSARLYYTSKGTEAREYSPGRLVMLVDGPPTVDGNYTIFCEWMVELSLASYETFASPTPPVPPTPPTPPVPPVPPTPVPPALITLMDLWGFIDTPGVLAQDGRHLPLELLGWDVADGSWLQLPHSISFVDDKRNARNFQYLYVDDYTIYPAMARGDQVYKRKFGRDSVLIKAGTTVTRINITLEDKVERLQASYQELLTILSRKVDLLEALEDA